MPTIITVGAATARAYGFILGSGSSPSGTFFFTLGWISSAATSNIGVVPTNSGYMIYGNSNYPPSGFPYDGSAYALELDANGGYVSSNTYRTSNPAALEGVVKDTYGNTYVGGTVTQSPYTNNLPLFIAPISNYSAVITGTDAYGPASIVKTELVSGNILYALGYGPDNPCCYYSAKRTLYRLITYNNAIPSLLQAFTANFLTYYYGGISDFSASSNGQVAILELYGTYCICCSFGSSASVMNGSTQAGAWKVNLPLISSTQGTIVKAKLDSNGNLYLLITSNNPAVTVRYVSLAKFNSSGVFQWEKQWTPTNDLAVISSSSILIDSLDNVYVTYIADPPTLVSRVHFISFNQYGVPQFSRQITTGTNGFATLKTPTLDNNGGIYMSGQYDLATVGPSGGVGMFRLPIDGTHTGSGSINISGSVNSIGYYPLTLTFSTGTSPLSSSTISGNTFGTTVNYGPTVASSTFPTVVSAPGTGVIII